MICYKDRTFCPFTTCANAQAGTCSRALTEEDKKRAAELKLPISQYAERPSCYVPTGG